MTGGTFTCRSVGLAVGYCDYACSIEQHILVHTRSASSTWVVILTSQRLRNTFVLILGNIVTVSTQQALSILGIQAERIGG